MTNQVAAENAVAQASAAKATAEVSTLQFISEKHKVFYQHIHKIYNYLIEILKIYPPGDEKKNKHEFIFEISCCNPLRMV